MCHPAIAIAALGTGAYLLSENKAKKEEKKAQNKINSSNQSALKQIEQNKIANGTQSTVELTNPTLADKLKQQKVPLNTGNTGVTTGSPNLLGLNIGGY